MDVKHIRPYSAGEYEAAVTRASRLYARGETTVAEFRAQLKGLRLYFNRVPAG